jgi:hypothetical protein
MKNILIAILTWFCSYNLTVAQTAAPSGKKINFSGVSVVAPTDLSYKTLTLRYEEVKNKAVASAPSEGGTFKWFKSKKEAVEYFEANKESADKETIYIIDSADKSRKPEVLTFKINKPKAVNP